MGGAELFVENVAGASRRLGLSLLAVGLLLAGAEPEELVTAVLAALRDRPGLAAGDALGANVTMLTVVLGLAALLRPLAVGHRVRVYAALSSVAGVLALVAVADERVGRVEGLALVAAYAALVAVVWWRERTPPALGELAEIEAHAQGDGAARDPGDGTGDGPAGRDDAPGRDGDGTRRPAVALLLALAGVALMAAGGSAAVEGAVRVVEALGQTDTAVGLTVLALATTAELFALVLVAARHDVPEVAVAGVVGSAAYNATLTLGAAAAARPLDTGDVLWPAVAGAALPLVLLVLARSGTLSRAAGALLVAGYAVFVVTALA